jgi:hypothetical protein
MNRIWNTESYMNSIYFKPYIWTTWTINHEPGSGSSIQLANSNSNDKLSIVMSRWLTWTQMNQSIMMTPMAWWGCKLYIPKRAIAKFLLLPLATYHVRGRFEWFLSFVASCPTVGLTELLLLTRGQQTPTKFTRSTLTTKTETRRQIPQQSLLLVHHPASLPADTPCQPATVVYYCSYRVRTLSLDSLLQMSCRLWNLGSEAITVYCEWEALGGMGVRSFWRQCVRSPSEVRPHYFE